LLVITKGTYPRAKLNKKYNNQEGIEFSLDDIELVTKAYRYLKAFSKHLHMIHLEKYPSIELADKKVKDIVEISFNKQKNLELSRFDSSISNLKDETHRALDDCKLLILKDGKPCNGKGTIRKKYKQKKFFFSY